MRILAFFLLMVCIPASAQQCENLIALSKTVSSTVADKSAFEQHAANFCSEYKKSGSSSAETKAAASWKFISASYGQSNMSTDEVASKACSAQSSQSVSADAYKQYVETIARGAYGAYETCIRLGSSNDLKFDADVAASVPSQFTIVIGYAQAVQGATTAVIGYSASAGVSCTWNGKAADETVLTAPGSVQVKCIRTDQSKPGYAKFTRTNGVGGSLTIPLPAYDSNGIPTATLEQIKKDVSTVQRSLIDAQRQLVDAQRQLGALNASSSKQVFICPVHKTPGLNPGGGAWGFYGCQGQVTTQSTCTNIEFPWQEQRACTASGQLKLY